MYELNTVTISYTYTVIDNNFFFDWRLHQFAFSWLSVLSLHNNSSPWIYLLHPFYAVRNVTLRLDDTWMPWWLPDVLTNGTRLWTDRYQPNANNSSNERGGGKFNRPNYENKQLHESYRFRDVFSTPWTNLFILYLFGDIIDIVYIAHLRQKCQDSKFVIFQEKCLEILKCYNFLWVQRRHNCSPAASFANCVMTLYLLILHLQTFISIPVTPKCKILSFDTLVANERHTHTHTHTHTQTHT